MLSSMDIIKLNKRFCAVLSHSVMSDSATPWNVALQASLSMGFLQARILEWVAMSSSRGSSQPREETQVSCIAGRFLTTREAQETLRQHIPTMLVLRMKHAYTGCLAEPSSHKTWLLPLPGVKRSYLLPPSSRSSSDALSCRKPSPRHPI